MATIFPDVERMSVVFASQAEQDVYELAKKLSDSWRVYYSCTLSTKESEGGIKEGEIDFIFYHPHYGVIVVEVKGGRISLDGATGQFYSENRHGRSFAIRNPFQQAIAFRNRFVRFLRQNDVQVPVSHAVCFPQVNENEFPTHVNIEPATLLGRHRLSNMEVSLPVIAKSFHSDSFLNFDDVAEKLDALLVGATFKSRPLLREYIDSQEARVQEIDALHEVLISPVTGVSRLGVEGDAGTGKTLIATGLAKHFAALDQRVIILVSSPLLAGHLQNEVGENIVVKTFQEFSSSYGVNLLVAPSDFDKGADHWIQYEAPERLRQAIAAQPNRYDVLLVDEAQDVQPFWWVALEALLDDVQTSRLYVFFDRGQGVFGGGEGQQAFHPEDVLPVPHNYISLGKNYRNTSEISQFARSFKRGKQGADGLGGASNSERVGYHPSIIGYRDPNDAVTKLNHLVKRLTVELGIREEEIVVLSARAPDSRESILSQQSKIGGLNVTRITAEGVRSRQLVNPGELGVATVAAFKGLEAKIVIAVNFSEHKMSLDNPIMSSLAYVALTRAKHMLYVLLQEDDDKYHKFVDAASRIRSGGSMVLDAEDRPGEYTGRIVHFNPSRLAVLEMLTGEDLGKTVIALPQDMERSGVESFKSSQLVRFRIRAEGGIATAINLSLVTEEI